MAKNADNTWSATEAKENQNQQEISNMVRVQNVFFYLFCPCAICVMHYHLIVFSWNFLGEQFVNTKRWRSKSIGRK